MQIKAHFTFSKKQRNGIFFLILLIIGLQCICFFIVPMVIGGSENEISFNDKAFSQFKKEIDSLRTIELENRKPKVFPFNPNYITDYKGTSLGMSSAEIDRLLIFREQNKWIRTVKQFQDVTKISDSLLNAISPYFKFPERVIDPKVSKNPKTSEYDKWSKTFTQKEDLNVVTARQLQKIGGIGEVLSERIIKYRNKFPGGFIADIQLWDVYGLNEVLITKITNQFTVKTPRNIKKLDINEATLDDLVTIQHIDYNLAHDILEERQLRQGYKSLDELMKVKGFPVNKIDIIKLYLTLD